MQVVVRPGACLIEGATGYETEDRTMVVQAAGATDRIDSVVLRLNDNIDYRDIDLYVIKGNSSSEPPELTRTGGVYEIGLANLYVSANSATITTERITDTRLVTERCGYAMPVQKFDTTALFDQLQAQVNENIELIQRAINQTEAAHLQEQIDSISSDIGTTSIVSISDGTLKGAVAKHEQDVNSLNLKLDGNATYSMNEVNTHKKWINERDIYRKVYNIATLPANTATCIDSTMNASKIQSIVHFEGCATDKNNALVPIPYHNSQQNSYDNYWYITTSGLYITTMSIGGLSQATITIEYTKK